MDTESRARSGSLRQLGGDVVAWRAGQLVLAGFPRRLASRLAKDARLDLHGLIDLTERGCPPALAARILAPLEDEHPS